MFWSKKKQKKIELNKIREENLRKCKEVEDFQEIGKYVEFMGVKCLVRSYHRNSYEYIGVEFNIRKIIIPALNCVLVNKNNEFQIMEFNFEDLKFLEKVD
jgi:hypothetical protein